MGNMNPKKSILHGKVIAPDPLYPTVFKAIIRSCQTLPQHIAIIHGNEEVSYTELSMRVAAFARELRDHGVKTGDLIPICTDGGIDMIVSMIAVWATGAAFVPVDIHAPHHRLLDILNMIDSKVIIADAETDAVAGRACMHASAPVSAQTVLNTDMGSDASSLAYGFFTSGSTGTPKCCLNIHSGLMNRMQVMSRYFGLQAGEAVLQNSRHVFDSSLWQIFWPLSVGGKVVIPERDSIVDVDKTLNEIEKHQVVTTDFVPSILELVLQSIALTPSKAEKLASLHYLIVGGEAVNEHVVSEVHRYLPDVQLVNTYGPTEASIGMVIHLFERDKPGVIPLGTPIDNTSVMVVDEQLQVLPVGETGEIVIGGRCLGQGYLNDPERTRNVFVDQSGLAMLESERIYRTGDLGHIGTDGLLYFNGRLDDQVKIAGVRIELGEIEHHMHRFHGIRQAKVVCINSCGQQRLAGFFRADETVDIRVLREHLAAVLPENTMPSLLLQIEKFPRTTSGKIDGKALIRSYCSTDYGDNQQADSKEQLLSLCQRLLPGVHIDCTSDLMLAGMDSLQMLQLSLEIKKLFAQELPLWSIKNSITVEHIHHLLETTADGTHSDDDQALLSAMNEDIEYWSSIALSPVSKKEKSTAPSVLLTGATGYVGGHILVALLRHTTFRIVCLIRAEDAAQARQRLQASADTYQWKPDWSRISFIAGDLNTLSLETLSELNLHSIVHTAAEVNFMKNYHNLADANVKATARLCQFTTQLGLSRLHYISSMGVLTTAHSDPSTYPLSAEILPHSGYSRSKWVAEAIVHRLAKRGLPVHIYRLGEMMPDNSSPIANTKSVISILTKAALTMKMIPQLDERFHYTPITMVADHIARCVQQEKATAPTITENLYHPDLVDLTAVIEAASGTHDQQPVDRDTFRASINSRLVQGTDDEDLIRASLLLQSEDHLLDETMEVHSDNKALDSIAWPVLDPESLSHMMAGFRV